MRDTKTEDRFLSLIGDLNPRVTPTIENLEVDFELNGLVIEIDGPGHNRPRTRREDATRDAILHAAGYSVLRLTPDELT